MRPQAELLDQGFLMSIYCRCKFIPRFCPSIIGIAGLIHKVQFHQLYSAPPSTTAHPELFNLQMLVNSFPGYSLSIVSPLALC